MLPKISIIIPVKPGGEVKALEPLRQVEYPADSFEVLVAEGRRPSSQRNKAAAEASGELLYFLDDDSLVDPGFLRRVIGHFSDPQVAVAGGPSLTPSTDSLRQRAFGAALSSPFGGDYYPTKYLFMSAVIRYSLLDPGDKKELFGSGGIGVRFPALQANIDYSYGKRNGYMDNRVEKRFSANLKKQF